LDDDVPSSGVKNNVHHSMLFNESSIFVHQKDASPKKLGLEIAKILNRRQVHNSLSLVVLLAAGNCVIQQNGSSFGHFYTFSPWPHESRGYRLERGQPHRAARYVKTILWWWLVVDPIVAMAASRAFSLARPNQRKNDRVRTSRGCGSDRRRRHGRKRKMTVS
jgi:hypothetical protein